MSNLPPPPPPENSALSFLAESSPSAPAPDGATPAPEKGHGKGKKKKKTKVSRKTLKTPEEQRKSTRRLIMIAGGSIVALLIVGAIATVFLRPAAESEHQARTSVAAAPLAEENVPALPERLDDLAAGEEPLSGSLKLVKDTILQRAAAFDNAALDGDTLAGLGRQRDERRGETGPVAREAVPKAQRWEIRWPPTSTEVYAQQLDFFGIELAAIGGGIPTIDYGSHLGEKKPTLRSQPAGTQDNRLYFAHRANSKRLDVDRMLLSSAGVNTNERVILQFLPAAVEEHLTKLEREHTGAKKLEDVMKTIFGIRQGGQGYEFYVIEQRLRGGG